MASEPNLRVVFVAPMAISSGEAVTAMEMAQTVVERGGAACVVCPPSARSLGARTLPVVELTASEARNREVVAGAVNEWSPQAVVFADYPLLFLSSGAARIRDPEGLVESLADDGVELVTLDHIGYAQRDSPVFFGPPHLSLQSEELPPPPPSMRVLLPCPLNEPGESADRRGVPFRAQRAPLRIAPERRAEVRRRYLAREGDLLVCHAVPTWSARFVEAYGLPNYRFLPSILDEYFSRLAAPVTVVSVNDGRLLEAPPGARTRFVNEAALPKAEYEALLLSADLFVTENKVSTTLGKAVCGLVPSAVLKNSYGPGDALRRLTGRLRDLALAMESSRRGSIFPYEVFPVWSSEDLDGLGLFRDNSVAEAFRELELWGGAETEDALRRLLSDESTRDELRHRQRRYVERLATLPDAWQALTVVRSGARSG